MTKKKKNIRELDPFLEREREQYDNPLPSREYILQMLAEKGVPLEQDELCTLLQIEHHEARAIPAPPAGNGARRPDHAQSQGRHLRGG